MLLNTDEMKAALNYFNESSEPEAKRVREVIFQMKENKIPSLPAFVLALEHVKEVKRQKRPLGVGVHWAIELFRDAAIQHDQNMGPFQKRLEEERILEDISLKEFIYVTMEPRRLGGFFDQYPLKNSKQRQPSQFFEVKRNWTRLPVFKTLLDEDYDTVLNYLATSTDIYGSRPLPKLENLDTTIDYLWTDFLALRGLKRKVAKSLTEPEKQFFKNNYPELSVNIIKHPKMPIMDFIDEASLNTCSLLKTLEIAKSAIVEDDLRKLQ
eukprot:GHVL01030488.1.p1 GENE.GHVL01030488.1~~GHVL01030488.1.p1  ORF type:complete len:307 (-),score=50.26 GHVL01030488.1:384-1184(-)